MRCTFILNKALVVAFLYLSNWTHLSFLTWSRSTTPHIHAASTLRRCSLSATCHTPTTRILRRCRVIASVLWSAIPSSPSPYKTSHVKYTALQATSRPNCTKTSTTQSIQQRTRPACIAGSRCTSRLRIRSSHTRGSESAFRSGVIIMLPPSGTSGPWASSSWCQATIQTTIS